MKIIPHCQYCVLSPNKADSLHEYKLIFLDMEGVMIQEQFDPALETKVSSKAMERFGPEEQITHFQWSVTFASYLDKGAVKRIMILIQKIHQAGYRAGIVISAGWRIDSLTSQLSTAMFSKQPFSRYIIGRTCSLYEDDPELLASQNPEALHEYVGSNYGLSTRGREITHWIQQHNSGSFVIFDDNDEEIRSLFPTQFIQTKNILENKHINRAIEVLELSS